MMKKTGAGLLRFSMSIFLLGAWIATAGEQDVPASATLAAFDATEVSIERTFRTEVDQRLALLKNAGLDALKQAKDECEKAAQDLAVKGPELRQAARTAYEDARLNSDAAKEIYKQIAELEQKLDQTLRDLPEVKEKLAEIQRVEESMLVELHVRTALSGLIAAREQGEAAMSPE